jgi:hypothetical protein
MELNTGSLETLGEHTGGKKEISNSSEASITLESKAPAHGQHQSIHGPKTFEIKRSPPFKNPSRNLILQLALTNVKELHQKKSKKVSLLPDHINIST